MILRGVEGSNALVARGLFFRYVDVEHAVNAIIHEAFVLLAPGYQVIAVVRIEQLNRSFFVDCAIASQHSLLVFVVLEVLELDFATHRNGAADGVDVVENRLVLCFDAAFHMDAFL